MTWGQELLGRGCPPPPSAALPNDVIRCTNDTAQTGTPPPSVGFCEKLKIHARLIVHKPAPGDAHLAGDQPGVHTRAHGGKHRVHVGDFSC